MEGDSRNPRVSLLKKYDIPIDHLTYEYVRECTNKKELEKIIRILRSGEEGSYPDLLKVTEECLRKIAPDSRVLHVETPILTKDSLTNEEWKSVESDIFSWEDEMKVMDESLNFEKNRLGVGNKNLPGVRKVVQAPLKMESKKIKAVTNSKNERIKSGDYAAWDKFDVDKELLKIDVEDERKWEENEKKKREIKKEMKEKKIDLGEVDRESYSATEQQLLANQAKDRGNECYKSGDLETALKYYDISIKFYTTANAYNNRAMIYLKLNEYQKAIDDCNKVLSLEKNNVKALFRRATAYQNMPDSNDNKYAELALHDLNRIVILEPNNKVAQADLQKLKKKLNIEDIGNKFRMPIYEKGRDSDKENIVKKSVWNVKDHTSVEKLPLTYYGPSTSTFRCEPYSMIHRALSESPISGQILCKCNSNRRKQNPLCQRCGEAMCKPKPSTKTVTSKNKSDLRSITKKENQVKNQLVSEELKKNEKDIANDSLALRNIQKVEEKKEEIDSAVKPATKMSEGDFVFEKKIDHQAPTDKNEKVSEKENLVVERPNNSEELKPECRDVESSQLEVYSKSEDTPKDKSKQIEESSRVSNKLDASSSITEQKNIDLRDLDNVEENPKVFVETHKAPPVVNSVDQLKNTNNEKAECSKSNLYNNNINLNNYNNKEMKNLEASSSHENIEFRSKKMKNKKKKSKPHKETKPAEPVKIVHAAKYLHPTSVEPKVKNGSQSSDKVGAFSLRGTPTGDGQFKTFVPNKESGRLGFPSGSHHISPVTTTPEVVKNVNPTINRVGSDLSFEGNKENMSENKSTYIVENVGRDGDNKRQPVESAFEFLRSWEELKKIDESYVKRAEIIKQLRPGDIGKVIGVKLDSELLSSLLKCLETHFIETNPKTVVEFLNQFPQLPRFNLVKMFLADSDLKVLNKLIKMSEEKGFTLEEDIKKNLSSNS